jgi:hypothetical protein
MNYDGWKFHQAIPSMSFAHWDHTKNHMRVVLRTMEDMQATSFPIGYLIWFGSNDWHSLPVDTPVQEVISTAEVLARMRGLKL